MWTMLGLPPAIDDVEGGHRHHHLFAIVAGQLCQVAVERNLVVGGGGLCDGERNAQNSVGAKLFLVWRAVQLEQQIVHRRLVGQVEVLAYQRLGDCRVHVANRLRDALAMVLRLHYKSRS